MVIYNGFVTQLQRMLDEVGSGWMKLDDVIHEARIVAGRNFYASREADRKPF